MNLVQLRYVKAVAAAGSFSMAARDCGVSQPTISNAISDLEEELGTKLFRRTTRCVELTPFGASIMTYIDTILVLVEDIEQEAEACLRPERKVLRVAFSPIIDGPRLMHAFEAFQRSQPGLAFIYKECGVDELESRLGQEKIDVICGIRIQDRPTLGRCLLYWDTLRFLPQGGLDRYEGASTINLRDISREALILTVDLCGLAPAIRDLFRRRRLQLKEYGGHPMSYHVVQEWADQGIGAAILPESRVAGDATAYPLVVSGGRPVTLAIEAVWMRGSSAPEHVKFFVNYLKESSNSALGGLRAIEHPIEDARRHDPPPYLVGQA
jgi:LysR family transcriptional regulator, hydrogen peroxide-inducible genes activator